MAGWVGLGVSASLHAAAGVWLAHTDLPPREPQTDDALWTLALPPAGEPRGRDIPPASHTPPPDRPPPSTPPTPPPPAGEQPRASTPPVTPRPPVVVQKPPMAIEDVRLGVEASSAEEGAWLGGPEAREHRATLSEVNQPALTTQEAGTPNSAGTTGTPGPIRPAPSPAADPAPAPPSEAKPAEGSSAPAGNAAARAASDAPPAPTPEAPGPTLPAPPTTPDPTAGDRRPDAAPDTPAPVDQSTPTGTREVQEPVEVPEPAMEAERDQPEPPALKHEAVSIDPFGTLVMATPTAGVLTLRLPPGVSPEDVMRAPASLAEPPAEPTPAQTTPPPSEDSGGSGAGGGSESGRSGGGGGGGGRRPVRAGVRASVRRRSRPRVPRWKRRTIARGCRWRPAGSRSTRSRRC